MGSISPSKMSWAVDYVTALLHRHRRAAVAFIIQTNRANDEARSHIDLGLSLAFQGA